MNLMSALKNLEPFTGLQSLRCASNHLIVSVYRVPQMQGVGRADVLSYFKCPTTKQMRCAVNAYKNFVL